MGVLDFFRRGREGIKDKFRREVLVTFIAAERCGPEGIADGILVVNTEDVFSRMPREGDTLGGEGAFHAMMHRTELRRKHRRTPISELKEMAIALCLSKGQAPHRVDLAVEIAESLQKHLDACSREPQEDAFAFFDKKTDLFTFMVWLHWLPNSRLEGIVSVMRKTWPESRWTVLQELAHGKPKDRPSCGRTNAASDWKDWRESTDVTYAQSQDLLKMVPQLSDEDLAHLLKNVAQSCFLGKGFSYLSSIEYREKIARLAGETLYKRGGKARMRHVLNRMIGEIPGRRTIDVLWNDIGRATR